VRRLFAALTIPVLLLVIRPGSAQADGGLQVVTVRSTSQMVTAVVGLDPAPLAPLARDGVFVTTLPATSGSSPRQDGKPVPATVSPVVDLTAGTPLGLVVDASGSGADAQAQTLNGSVGLLLRLPNGTPVAVVADGSPPRLLTPDRARPADAITALTSLSTTAAGSAGGTSTEAALDLAVQHLPRSLGGARLVVLTTSGAPPAGEDAERLIDRLVAAGVVLGVVGIDSAGTTWKEVAAATGGTAVAAVPTDSSAAYDGLLEALQGRYLVRFTPPPGAAQVALAITSAGQRYTTQLTIPGPRGKTPAPGAAPAAPVQTSSSAPGWIAAAVAVLVGLVLLSLLVLRRQRRGSGPVSASDAPADVDPAAPEVEATPVDPASLPGVRVFDLSDPERPTEIPAPAPASEHAAEPIAPVVAEEPVTGEPVTEEPVTEEPVTEEPVAEEPVAASLPEPPGPSTLPSTPPPPSVPAPAKAASSRPVRHAPSPEPSQPPRASSQYVGRHRAPDGIVDDDAEEDAKTDDVPSEPARHHPVGAHPERRQGADSIRGVR
jgi:hypothetical protein